LIFSWKKFMENIYQVEMISTEEQIFSGKATFAALPSCEHR